MELKNSTIQRCVLLWIDACMSKILKDIENKEQYSISCQLVLALIAFTFTDSTPQW